MIADILAGDRELYHRLIQPYELTVYRMALSFVKDEMEAEDVAQEAFLKAFRDLANFRGEAKFSTWLISITLNEARRRLQATEHGPDGVARRASRGGEQSFAGAIAGLARDSL